MDLYPAIDLRRGRCVRLVEGDFSQETVYSDDPVAVAESFAASGARWIHVVDLDAAATGTGANRDAVGRIAAAVQGTGTSVQTGGGVRRLDDVAELLGLGVARVVIGTAAVQTSELVAGAARLWPGSIAVGLDHRDGEVWIRGWTEGSGRNLSELVPAAVEAGASVVVVTDISRDGRLAGPDVHGLAELAAETGAHLIASGGISGIHDVQALAEVPGLVGVIAGKAIYEGKLDVAETVAWLAGRST